MSRPPLNGMARSNRLSWVAASIGLAAAAYATYVGVTWYRYGTRTAARDEESDGLLDGFMPAYEIAERHHIRVAAPAALTLAVAGELDLQASPIVRAIIRARELVLGATRGDQPHVRGLLAEVEALGWGVLARVPGREVVVGAVTRPWEPDVTFRAVPFQEFARFSEPGYVKIAWTIRADDINAAESVFRTETRAIATDADARKKFRRYWSFFSPGIILIRWAVLTPVKREAERRAREQKSTVRPVTS
jgi:hypothetical protein